MSAPVSRETPPPPTSAAAVLFAAELPRATQYAELLADAGVSRGLIGPREVARIWDRHLVNCALVADGISTGASVCDVGSGAGLPGLVLSIVRPDLQVTLLEPLLRRATFLQQAVDALGLSQVRVLRGRAEEHRDLRFDVVTARAVAPLDRLAGWCLPLCRSGGVLLAMKGASAPRELADHAATLQRLGAASWRVRTFSAADATTVAVEVVAGETETRSPSGRRPRRTPAGPRTSRSRRGRARRRPGP